MKKFLISVILTCFMLTFLLCGCGKKEKESTGFIALKDYTTVVRVTINPTVNLYLDADEIILAVEYVNADAEKCYSKVESKLVGSELAKGMNMVIETAESDGYFEDNKTVTIDVVESKQSDEKLEILAVATETAKTVITEKKIEAEVVLTETTQKEVDDKLAAEKAEAEKEAAEKAAAEKAAAEKAAAEKAAAEKAAAEKAAAEKAAAEKAAAEKAAAEKALKNPMKNLKKGVRYCAFKLDEVLTGIFIKFNENGEYSYSQVPYIDEYYDGVGAAITYNGKTYYEAGGGGGGGTYVLSEQNITLSGAFNMVLSMTTDGKLVVEKLNSSDNFFKVGTILTLE